jgi:hypothetical protein
MRSGPALFRQAAALLLVLPATVHGQNPPASVIIQPTVQRWEFSDTLRQGTLKVTSLEQAYLPVSSRLPMGADWNLDLSWAYARGSIAVGAEAPLELRGLTDVRVRLSGPIVRDHVLVTLGFNGPTGTVQLNEAQIDALRILGAPALQLGVPVFGTGIGGSGGLVFAGQLAGWAVAAGAAYEYRGRYSPVEALIAGAATITELDPAESMRYSLGVDRLVGPHRLSLLWSSDRFKDDRLGFPGATDLHTTYRLGNNTRWYGQFDAFVPYFRQVTLSVERRTRAEFRDSEGILVPGSNGSVTAAALSGILGPPRGFGLLLGADLRKDSGLELDDTFVTAAMDARAFTLGVVIPMGAASLRPFARWESGTLDLGSQAAVASGVSYGVRLGPR